MPVSVPGRRHSRFGSVCLTFQATLLLGATKEGEFQRSSISRIESQQKGGETPAVSLHFFA